MIAAIYWTNLYFSFAESLEETEFLKDRDLEKEDPHILVCVFSCFLTEANQTHHHQNFPNYNVRTSDYLLL